MSGDDALIEAIEAEYGRSERAYNNACAAVRLYREAHARDAAQFISLQPSVWQAQVRVNTKDTSELARLCGRQAKALARRNALLAQRADLLRKTGKIR